MLESTSERIFSSFMNFWSIFRMFFTVFLELKANVLKVTVLMVKEHLHIPMVKHMPGHGRMGKNTVKAPINFLMVRHI